MWCVGALISVVLFAAASWAEGAKEPIPLVELIPQDLFTSQRSSRVPSFDDDSSQKLADAEKIIVRAVFERITPGKDGPDKVIEALGNPHNMGTEGWSYFYRTPTLSLILIEFDHHSAKVDRVIIGLKLALTREQVIEQYGDPDEETIGMLSPEIVGSSPATVGARWLHLRYLKGKLMVEARFRIDKKTSEGTSVIWGVWASRIDQRQ